MTRYGEEIRGNLKLAVFVSMLPGDYQEEILQMGSGEKKVEYDSMRAYVLNLAQQRASAMQPRADIAGVDSQEEEERPEKQEESQEYQEGQYGYDWWNWGGDIGAITNP
eukprot:9322332-Karenia_brevis.AAC.1